MPGRLPMFTGMTTINPAPEQAPAAEQIARLTAKVDFLTNACTQLSRIVELLADRQQTALDKVEALHAGTASHARALEHLVRRSEAVTAHLRDLRDRDLPGLADRLEAVRRTPEYAAAFDEDEPLVSVVIATYNKPRDLVEVAIPSVLAQTYRNLEVVVVHDGPSDETRRAVEAVGDPRIRYHELVRQHERPVDAYNRWLVAAAEPKNYGFSLARGAWTANIDDDDEYAPDHLEKLLTLARDHRAELAYGTMRQHFTSGEVNLVWSDPPAKDAFSFLSALQVSAINFIERDLHGHVADEAEDWRLVRRMIAAGVRHVSTRDVVATAHVVPYAQRGMAR